MKAENENSQDAPHLSNLKPQTSNLSPSDASRERLAALRSDMEKCFRCSLCKMVPLPTANNPKFTDACPAARLFHFHGYSGSGKQIMALSLLDGRIQPDEALARIAFACTACGYCDVACKFIMDAERHRVNMALREHLVGHGLAPAAFADAIAKLPGAATTSEWAHGLGLKTAPGQRAEYLLLASCSASPNSPAARVARLLARLLQKAGLDLAILESEPCCGLPAYWMNHRELFVQMARANTELLEKTGAAKVIVTSGSCLGAFRSKYAEYATKPGVQIIHASEILAELIASGALILDKPVQSRVTYHDPCYLGRQSEPFIVWNGQEKTALNVMTYTEPPKPINYGSKGVFDPPRQILKAIPGLDFREMARIREYSFCCGAGGGAPLSNPELARSAATHRLEEARDTGAQTLVTACAHCEQQFTYAQAGADASDIIAVADLVELVAQAAGTQE